MKKIFVLMAAAMLTVTASAQQKTAVTGNKFGDNWYMGINVGAATPMQKWGDAGFMKGFAPKLGVRLGKNLTTVFGLAADADLYMLSKTDSKSLMGSKTFVNAMNLSLLGTFNLSNLFCGFKGEPRKFELIALGGFGWGHKFGGDFKANELTSKVALDFAFNLGAKKAWQLYIEPAAVFGLQKYGKENVGALAMNPQDLMYDSRNGLFQLSLGLNYKFGTSNGTHNFATVALRDQAEIDALNAQINEARSDADAAKAAAAAKDAQIAQLKKALKDCENRPVQVVEKKEGTTLQPVVIFRQGSATIDKAQYASIEMVANYMKNHKDAKVKIQGYASPEGAKAFNQKLSEKRAAIVKDALVKKYKIAADRIETEGLGATDKLSAENDFNRVAMFIDTTK
jgi:outer membrane protein OmpA-like peptidoglycan-associated protein